MATRRDFIRELHGLHQAALNASLDSAHYQARAEFIDRVRVQIQATDNGETERPDDAAEFARIARDLVRATIEVGVPMVPTALAVRALEQ